MRSGLGARGRVAFLLATTVLTASVVLAAYPLQASAQAATQQVFTFNISAKPVRQGLNDISRITGLSVVFSEASAGAAAGNTVSGAMTREQALTNLLAGTGLSWSFTNGNTVTITNRVAQASEGVPNDGSLLLDTITIDGGGGESSVYSPYETAAATSHISGENIERFRGTSPSDIFKGTPGAMSGNSRASAGAIDVNVRGLQGMGRVKVTVDDAENSVSVYQGYQGQSNRTYIDPDFIAGIDIAKGGDAASRGMAGTVAMRTVSANDIVKEGDTWGVRVKGGFGTNTSTPTDGATAGYTYSRAGAVASETGLDRPSFLTPTNGSASIVAAVKEENWDILAGYAYRKQGNYHAGESGGEGVSATPTLTSVRNTSTNTYYDTYLNSGYTNYRPGEEVLNTALETQSFLLKGNLRFDDNDEHSLQWGYNNFRSESGYMVPVFGASMTQTQNKYGATTGIRLDTGTLKYRWNPEDNDLIDMKLTGWVTYHQVLNDARLVTDTADLPATLGLGEDFRTGTNTLMWGTDLTNTSKFNSDRWGDIDLTYGASYLSQSVDLGRYAEEMSFTTLQGDRKEVSGFAKASYKPLDWLTLNAGLRYSRYSADSESASQDGIAGGNDGWSPSVGVTIEPLDGVQLYANYASTLRMPSLVEMVGVSGVSMTVDENLSPERLNSIDVGVNLTRDGLLADSDRGMLKFGWFDWDVDNYISRATTVDEEDNTTALYIHNIAGAKFSGLELSARYEAGGFTADLSANYFTNVEYCVTADTCGNMSLYGDYATNYVPPEYMINLTLSQKFLEDRLTLGGRVYHVGPRSAGHGSVTATGASQFITQIEWDPYTLFDVFAEYKINDHYTVSARVENLTDQFYVDPLGQMPLPGPGRTFYASLTGTFGGDQKLPSLSSPFRGDDGSAAVDWTGLYAGFSSSFAQARTTGTTSVLDATAGDFGGGLAAGIAASESADLDFFGGQIGVQAGYNWQLRNRLVVGIEADWNKSWAKGQQDNIAIDDEVVAAGGWLGSRNHHDIDWSGSLRGRLGYALDNGLMIYGTAGVSILRENVARDQYYLVRVDESIYSSGSVVNGAYTHGVDNGTVRYVDQDSATRVGGIVGLGGEYAINDRWSLKAEYNYSRFGKTDYEFENARAGTYNDYRSREITGYTPVEAPIYEYTTHDGGYSIVNGRQASNSLDLHTFRIGLNYRF